MQIRFPELCRRGDTPAIPLTSPGACLTHVAFVVAELSWGEGAKVLLHPAAFINDTAFHSWHAFATTRALENQVHFFSELCIRIDEFRIRK